MASYFEQEGIRRQQTAYHFWQAMKQFQNSCYLCATTGKHLNCDKCGIKTAYEENLENFKMNCRSPQKLEVLELYEVAEP